MAGNEYPSSKIKILWINPVNVTAYNQGVADRIAAIKLPNIEVHVVSLTLREGVHLTDLEYQANEAVVEEPIMRVAHWAGQNGFAAVALGCFYDTGLDAARENSGEAFVVAPCQAALSDIAMFGKRFSVVIGQDKWKDTMGDNILKYGLKDRLASFRSCDMSVPEIQKDYGRAKEAMLNACRLAIEQDGADVVVVGTGADLGFIKEIEQKLNVSIVDSLDACYMAAQTAALKHGMLGMRPQRSKNMKAMDEKMLMATGIFAGDPPVGDCVIVAASSQDTCS